MVQLDLPTPAELAADDVQPDATWGLDRIDQRDLPLDTKYRYNLHRRRRPGVHARHRDPDHARGLRRPRDSTATTPSTTTPTAGLPRPRDARRRHGGQHDVRRRQGRRARRGTGGELRRRRVVLATSSKAVDWVTANASKPGRGEHEPRASRSASVSRTRSRSRSGRVPLRRRDRQQLRRPVRDVHPGRREGGGHHVRVRHQRRRGVVLELRSSASTSTRQA